MKTIRIVALGLALGLLGAGCAASGGGTAPSGAGNVPNADVSGTWTGTVMGPNLNRVMVFTLQQAGSNVTGDLRGHSGVWGGQLQGTVTGNHFSWKTVTGPGGGELVASGNEMTGKIRSHYGDGTATLRRGQ